MVDQLKMPRSEPISKGDIVKLRILSKFLEFLVELFEPNPCYCGSDLIGYGDVICHHCREKEQARKDAITKEVFKTYRHM